MRRLFLNLVTTACAITGARWALEFGETLAPYLGSGPSPLGLLLVVPAAMLAALIGSIAVSAVLPRRSR